MWCGLKTNYSGGLESAHVRLPEKEGKRNYKPALCKGLLCCAGSGNRVGAVRLKQK